MLEKKKVAFFTLGCKLNFTETSAISRSFAENGFELTEFKNKADFYVINTCSVTENADKKFMNILNRAKKLNPNAYNIVIGCYAQLKPESISNIQGVDLVLGANEKFNIVKHLNQLDKEKTLVYSCDINNVNSYESSYSVDDRTRSFLKVQDGCDYKCTYCTIPKARGISRSDSLENIKRNISDIISKGVKEIVLTGVNIGDFGHGTDEQFFDLIKELDKIDGIDRFRISSIEPDLLKNEIIDFVSSSDKFAPHFHIPLQSGSDNLLKKMRRRYTTDLYRQRINRIKKLMPDACIGVDVIVGFPSETEEEFQKTMNFLIDLPISYLHVFTYSERANTTAPRMEGSVPMATRKKRSQQLRNLSEKKKRAFYLSQINKKEKVVFEQQQENGIMFGFTSNYIKVKTGYNPYMINQTGHVKLLDLTPDGAMSMVFTKEEQKTEQITELKVD